MMLAKKQLQDISKRIQRMTNHETAAVCLFPARLRLTCTALEVVKDSLRVDRRGLEFGIYKCRGRFAGCPRRGTWPLALV